MLEVRLTVGLLDVAYVGSSFIAAQHSEYLASNVTMEKLASDLPIGYHLNNLMTL